MLQYVYHMKSCVVDFMSHYADNKDALPPLGFVFILPAVDICLTFVMRIKNRLIYDFRG